MTTVWDSGLAGPAVHALVIGVGAYDWFPDGPRHVAGRKGDRLSGTFTQLGSPPASARALCEGLLEGFRDLPGGLSLGSLEAVVSAEQEMVLKGGDGARVPLGPATFAGVEEAFRAWYDRCDSDPNNVALFFFCGHGVQVGRGPQALLLQDTGENVHDYFRTAVDLHALVQGMEKNSALIQCFFVDACRIAPSWLYGAGDVRAARLLTPDPQPRTRDRVVVHSTLPGTKAHGPSKGVTRFTKAVLRALLTPESDSTGAAWAVTTETVGKFVRELMAWPGLGSDVSAMPEQRCDFSSLSTSQGSVLFSFDEAPPVPFHFNTSPGESLSDAEWALMHMERRELYASRPPMPEAWIGHGPVGPARVEVSFADGRFRGCGDDVWMQAPCRTRTVEVQEL
ncbi:caspase family protein [Streptomyces hirsutus]|uniref:caspase family protein n=1 Tax=Streptomyces hirsutus TaxID=35620 RepID=UPI0006E2EBA5|nr:caspase family protein [Streptomyces hirsutus]